MARQGMFGMEELIRSKINKIRHWKLTSLGKKRPKWGFEFTLMTYNILSQAALDCHSYLYKNCNPQFLSEEYRISRILPEILKSKSDVVCLQEVEQHLFDQRIRKVSDSNGFGSIFKKRTGSKTDGCAILWRRTKFNLLKHHEVEFRTRDCDILNRDNIGLIAVLKPLHPHAAQTQLHVATTHLIFNPRRGDVKLCQLRLLLAELERSAFKTTSENGRVYHPTILCGDFNLEPYSPLYKFIDDGRLELSGLISGDMSGQQEGRNKGGKLFLDRVSMDKLGIDESGRFNQIPVRISGSNDSSKDLSVDKPSESGKSYKSTETNGSRLNSSYLILREFDIMQAQQKVEYANKAVNNSEKEFVKDSTPESSSSSSESESESKILYHDFNFMPTYKYHHQDSRSFPVTSMTGVDTNTVDHIFYSVKQKNSTSYREDKLKLLGIYSLPCADDLREIGGLPNAHLGSDHLSLMSRFLIKP